MPPPPLPEYRVSHQGTIRGPFPLDFIEAMVLAGQFPHDIKVMRSNAGEWTPLSSELGESAVPKSQKPRVPDSKTVLAWIFSIGVISAVLALLVSLIALDSVRKSKNRSSSKLATASTSVPSVAPLPRISTPAPTPSKTPAMPWKLAGSSRRGAASTPTATPISFPVVSRPMVANITTPKPVVAPSRSTIYTDASGQTYSVSDHDYSLLEYKKSQIDTLRSSIDIRQKSLDELSDEISRERNRVDRRSQASVDAFNAKVSYFNGESKSIEASIKRFNSRVGEFNAELKRVGTPIR